MNTIFLFLLYARRNLCLALSIVLVSLFADASPLETASTKKKEGGDAFVHGILPPKQYFEDNDIQRYAVVIGISDYNDPRIADLQYADADAQAFYDFITSPAGGDFKKDHVLLLKNEQATLKNVTLSITNFLKKAKDPDFVVIFMACHGEPEPDRPSNLYLLMHDSEAGSLSATAYHMEDVNADMKRYIAAKRLVFFADACHSSGLTKSTVNIRGRMNTIHAALSTLKSTREGWGIVSASRASEVSVESNQFGGGHGVFTHYLLEGLRGKADAAGNQNGIVTLAEAFDFAEEKVRSATHNTQHPDVSGNFDNNLPLGFPGVETGIKVGAQKIATPPWGGLRIYGKPEGATVYIKGKEVGITPLNIKLASGVYPVMIKMRGHPDVPGTVFINPDEMTEVYSEQLFEQFYFGDNSGASGGARMAYADADRPSPVYVESGEKTNTTILLNNKKQNVTMPEAITPESTQSVYAETVLQNADLQKTKENIDALIKELETMVKKQTGEEKPVLAKKPSEKNPASADALRAVPVSVKEFNLKMGALSNRHNMEMLRQRIIDALLAQSDLRVVERDLELQEEILREQRLGGSLLADEMYRIELGKIQGAQFLCFGEVYPGEGQDQRMIRIEVVDTATTLIDVFEHPFRSEENLGTVAHDIAAKMREKIVAKRK